MRKKETLLEPSLNLKLWTGTRMTKRMEKAELQRTTIDPNISAIIVTEWDTQPDIAGQQGDLGAATVKDVESHQKHVTVEGSHLL